MYLNGKLQKLLNHFIYLGSNISFTESDINVRIVLEIVNSAVNVFSKVIDCFEVVLLALALTVI